MKLQLESQHLRFRISEAELAYLLDGLALCDETRLDEIHRQQRRLRLYEGRTAELDWRGAELELRLPRAPVLDYDAGLRGLVVRVVATGGTGLTSEVEVQVEVAPVNEGA